MRGASQGRLGAREVAVESRSWSGDLAGVSWALACSSGLEKNSRRKGIEHTPLPRCERRPGCSSLVQVLPFNSLTVYKLSRGNSDPRVSETGPHVINLMRGVLRCEILHSPFVLAGSVVSAPTPSLTLSSRDGTT